MSIHGPAGSDFTSELLEQRHHKAASVSSATCYNPRCQPAFFRGLRTDGQTECYDAPTPSYAWFLVLLPTPLVQGQVADVRQPPAHLGVVDGGATLRRDGQVQRGRRQRPRCSAGEADVLRTDDGRLEIVLTRWLGDLPRRAAGARRAVGHYRPSQSTDMQPPSSSRRPVNIWPITFITSTRPSASIVPPGAGDNRVTTLASAQGRAVVELAVARGSARIETDRGSLLVRTGERSSVREGGARRLIRSRSTGARWTTFDRRVRHCQEGRPATLSTAYLPNELQTYADAFDYILHLGPRSRVRECLVSDDGRRRVAAVTTTGTGSIGATGRNWVGREPWGWPTHHFGSWGFHHGQNVVLVTGSYLGTCARLVGAVARLCELVSDRDRWPSGIRILGSLVFADLPILVRLDRRPARIARIAPHRIARAGWTDGRSRPAGGVRRTAHRSRSARCRSQRPAASRGVFADQNRGSIQRGLPGMPGDRRLSWSRRRPPIRP